MIVKSLRYLNLFTVFVILVCGSFVCLKAPRAMNFIQAKFKTE